MSVIVFLIYSLFNSQYNLSTGVSSRINITVDKNQGKIKIGNLDGYDVSVEGLNVDECYFTTIDAFAERKASVEDMTKKTFRTEEEENKTVYYYENYIIEINGKELLIKNM